MSGLFSSPKMPTPVAPPAAPPPPPTIDDAARERDLNDAMRRRKGRAAALYAGKTGGSTAGVGGATKTLTGG